MQPFYIVILILVLGLIPLISAHAQSYKCTVDGKVIYQQAKCNGGTSVNTSGAGVANPSSPAALQMQREINALRRRELVEAAVLEGNIFIGMTAHEVVQSWGNPAKINKTISSTGAREQWIYRRGKIGYDQYVYVENGMVATIQTAQ